MAFLGGYHSPLVTIPSCLPQPFCKFVMDFFGGVRFLLQRAADGKQVQKAPQKNALTGNEGTDTLELDWIPGPPAKSFFCITKSRCLGTTAITVSRDPT
jgi:hypothetical protein